LFGELTSRLGQFVVESVDADRKAPPATRHGRRTSAPRRLGEDLGAGWPRGRRTAARGQELVSLSTVIQHHSVDDVKGYIHEAEALLVEGGYDDAERIALLPTVIQLLSSKTIMQQAPGGNAVDLSMLRGNMAD
jgi:hypothetical protein